MADWKAGAGMRAGRDGGGPGMLGEPESSFVKLFSVYVDKGLSHALEVFIALLEETGRGIGSIEITSVPIAEQWLQRQMVFALALHDHPVQASDLVVGQVIEYPVAQQLPGKIDQCVCHSFCIWFHVSSCNCITNL